MPSGPSYHQARRRDPRVARQRLSYKGAYNRALARLRDEHRGRFADFLREELDSRRADELLAQENARITDEWYEGGGVTDYQIDHCRSCDADIIWAVTVNDRPIPVDANPAPGGNLRLEPRGQTMAPRAVKLPPKLAFGARLRWPHHATCPHGKAWKRNRGGRHA